MQGKHIGTADNLVPRGSDNAYVGNVRIGSREEPASVNALSVGWRDAAGNMDYGTLTMEGTNAAQPRLAVATDLRTSDGSSGGNVGSVTQHNGRVTIGDDLGVAIRR